MNISNIRRVVLIVFILLIYTECYAFPCYSEQDTIKQDDSLEMNPNFYLELSKILNKEFFAGDSLSRFKNFFILKFFKIKKDLYFSLWLQPFFPEMNKTDKGYVWTDTNNMYYYCINGNSLIILDYRNSKGHGLYQQNTNKQAIEVMQYSREFHIPRLGEFKISCITYSIKDKDSFTRISSMLPLKYRTERAGLLKIVKESKKSKKLRESEEFL